jgi:hypothetical protein
MVPRRKKYGGEELANAWKFLQGGCANDRSQLLLPSMTLFVARSRQVCIYWLWKHWLMPPILSEGRANTYRHKKILSVECLPRANSWSLSS